jgi:homocysteine S-methyltransferase
MVPLPQLDLKELHILDGGMATELENKGLTLDSPLWSAQVLESSPESIVAVHREYLEAGADCILTASYQVSIEGFAEIGRSPKDAAESAVRAFHTSVELAERARREYQAASTRPIWIAGSLGPYGAMLHNGAEYHGNYDCTFDELVAFHDRRIAVMAATQADFFAFESIPSLQEARAILAALESYPKAGAYFSFTCRDGQHVSHGEPLRACGELLGPHPQVIGIGVNCTAPGWITSLIQELVPVTRKPIVVYPNSGEGWDAVNRCWLGDGEVREYGELARVWRNAGAQWIGGCCRTGPEHVRAVAQMFRG